MSEILFQCKIQVSKFGIKKNSKAIYRNKATGKPFIASNSKAKYIEDELTQRLTIERMKKRLSPINEYINVKMIFHYPETVYWTKKDTMSNRVADLSNLYQGPEDALTKAKVILDDRYIGGHDYSRRVVSPDKNYYLEIIITRLDP